MPSTGACRSMKPLQFAATLLALVSSASAGITFGPVRGQPGERVRLVVTKSFIRDGAMP